MALLREFIKTEHWMRRERPVHQVNAPIIRASGLTVRYESGFALQDVSFEIHPGERLAVVGPNGAGKTTLFKAIAGVITPTAGQVHVYGYEPGGHTCIAYVTQRSQVDWTFPVSVADVVMMGRIGRLGFFRQPRAKDWDIVKQSLETVNLAELSGRQISQLSGGQQQRMFIARALAQEAELMLMDEPTTGLDMNSQEELLVILEKLQRRGVTVLVALHDLKLAAERFERVMLLNHRLLGLGTPEEVFVPQALTRTYGSHLRLVSTPEGLLALEDTCCEEGVLVHD